MTWASSPQNGDLPCPPAGHYLISASTASTSGPPVGHPFGLKTGLGKNDPAQKRFGNSYLLAVLLTRCQRGQVTYGQAAKLLGIRKLDLCELLAYRALERAVWAYYLERFNHAFPECDRRAVMRPVVLDRPGSSRMVLTAGERPIGKRLYSDTELLSPPKREPVSNGPA